RLPAPHRAGRRPDFASSFGWQSDLGAGVLSDERAGTAGAAHQQGRRRLLWYVRPTDPYAGRCLYGRVDLRGSARKGGGGNARSTPSLLSEAVPETVAVDRLVVVVGQFVIAVEDDILFVGSATQFEREQLLAEHSEAYSHCGRSIACRYHSAGDAPISAMMSSAVSLARSGRTPWSANQPMRSSR